MKRLAILLVVLGLLALSPVSAQARGISTSAPADCQFHSYSVTDVAGRFYSPWLASRGINGGYEYLHDYFVIYMGSGGYPWEYCSSYIQFMEGQYTYYGTPGSYHTAMRVTVCGSAVSPQPGASNTNVLWTDTFWYSCRVGSSGADSWGSYFNGSYGGYAAVYTIAFA